MRRIIKIVCILGICWYFYTYYMKFKKEDIFNITQVDVEVKEIKLVKDLVRSLEKYKGENIWEISEQDLEENILKDVRVKNAVVKIKEPDTLLVKIEGKEPHIYVEYEGDIYIADELGEMFGYMKESDKYSMPLFRIKSKDEIVKFIEIMEKTGFQDKISQIYEDKDKIIVTKNNGLKLITNIDVKSEKYKITSLLYEQFSRDENDKKKIEYIDLRFQDYIVKYSSN